jgi:hypothetical protein
MGAPLPIIENRFPALFESRRMLYPRFEEFSDPARFDQGIGGFLDHIMKANFAEFLTQASAQTSCPVVEIERVGADGVEVPLSGAMLGATDTLIVISFDSIRTGQQAGGAETAAVRAFLDDPDHLVFVCPHHSVGDADNLSDAERMRLQERDFLHHGHRTIPPEQRFGGFGRSLLAGLGVPVENRFGCIPLMRRTARQRQSKPNPSTIVLAFPTEFRRSTFILTCRTSSGSEKRSRNWTCSLVSRSIWPRRPIHLSRAATQLSTACFSRARACFRVRFLSATRHFGAQPPEGSIAFAICGETLWPGQLSFKNR